MLEPAPDPVLIQVKILAQQQKRLNRQIMVFNIWFVWACAFLIFSVGNSYRNLNGTNAKYLYLVMNIIFLLSLFLKLIFWKRHLVHPLGQSKVAVLIKAFKQYLTNQQNLIISHLITFIILLGTGLIFYLLYIPDTSPLFWIIITPVSIVLLVFSCLFIFRLKQMKTQINRMFPEFIYD